MVNIMVSIFPDMPGNLLEEIEEVDTDETCPLATQDETINEENRNIAVASHNYRGPNTSTAFRNDESCGSCVFYDVSDEMMECIGDESGNLGYCRSFDFVCMSQNTCDMWMEDYKDNI